MSTAVEMRRRLDEWQARNVNVAERFARTAADLMINIKVPVIKYGRRKRRYRRMFPRIDDIRIAVGDALEELRELQK